MVIKHDRSGLNIDIAYAWRTNTQSQLCSGKSNVDLRKSLHKQRQTISTHIQALKLNDFSTLSRPSSFADPLLLLSMAVPNPTREDHGVTTADLCRVRIEHRLATA